MSETERILCKLTIRMFLWQKISFPCLVTPFLLGTRSWTCRLALTASMMYVWCQSESRKFSFLLLDRFLIHSISASFVSLCLNFVLLYCRPPIPRRRSLFLVLTHLSLLPFSHSPSQTLFPQRFFIPFIIWMIHFFLLNSSHSLVNLFIQKAFLSLTYLFTFWNTHLSHSFFLLPSLSLSVCCFPLLYGHNRFLIIFIFFFFFISFPCSKFSP